MKIKITITTIIIFLLISNILLQIIGFDKIIPKGSKPYAIFSKNKCLMYEFQANQSVEVAGKKLIINSLGLRDDEVVQKQKDEFRIISLGDSFTYGVGVVSNEETFSEQLEELLNNNYNSKQYNVINAGIPGYNIIQEYCLFKDKLIDLKPDFVIWNLYQNDLMKSQSLTLNKFNYYKMFPMLKVFELKIIKDITLFRFINYKLFKIVGNIIQMKYRDFDFNNNIKSIDDMIYFVKENNIPILIVEIIYPDNAIPYLDQFGFFIHSIILSKVDEHNISYLNTLQDLRNKTNNTLETLGIDEDRHLNYYGHEIVAESIYNKLIEEELIP